MIDLSLYKDKTVAILGLGKTGLSTATAMVESGANVLAWDDSESTRMDAAEQNIPVSDLSQINWGSVDRFVLSPGIPTYAPAPHPVVEIARESGIQPVADVELLFEAQPQAKYIGITGTNGKSTTTALIGHLLQKAGHNVQIGGNLGTAVLDLDPFLKGGIYVLELSSYQLELCHQTRFNMAILLNITEDHIERHGTLENYVAAKMRIFNNQTDQDVAIVGLDDPLCQAIYQGLIGQNLQTTFAISAGQAAPGGVSIVDSEVIDDMEQISHIVGNISDFMTLRGQHNWQNLAAAYTVARLMGERPEKILKHAETFPGLAHRQEVVRDTGTLLFINDSKATNPDSAAKAIASYKNIFWIAGGQAKKKDIKEIEPYFSHIQEAFYIGQDQALLCDLTKDQFPSHLCDTLDKAISAAVQAAKNSPDPAVILLSPAGASWDQFANFEARGDKFKDIVQALQLD